MIHAQLIEATVIRFETAGEIIKIVRRLGRPADFRQSCKPGESHVFHLADIGNVFRPNIALHPENVLLLLRGKAGGDGIQGINRGQRQVAADGARFSGAVLRLVIVQVTVRGRRHHHIVPLAGSFIGAADPVHHGGILREAALQNFAPTDQALAVRVHDLFDAANEVALQLFLVFQAFPLHQSLAGGIVFPRTLGHFIATNVNVRGREQSGDFGEHVLQKLKSLVFGRRIDAGVYAALQRHLERPGAAAEFGIGGKRRQGMAGHFNFRDNRNMQLLRVGDYFANVVLGVEAAVAAIRAIRGRR